MDSNVSALPRVHIARTADESGKMAALRVANALSEAIDRQGEARVVFASAPSQEAMLRHLSSSGNIDWSRVRSFHMDEYLGLPQDHPAAFGHWLRQRLPPLAREGFAFIRTDGDIDAEAQRYSALIDEAAIDIVCLGIGVNGHIAFNEPYEADPDDAQKARIVVLDTASRQQQVDEGLFSRLSDVPTHALSLTIPALLSGRSLVCSVVGAHKSDAVARALQGPIDRSIPASYLRTHTDASWFLDPDAAVALNNPRSDTLPL